MWRPGAKAFRPLPVGMVEWRMFFGSGDRAADPRLVEWEQFAEEFEFVEAGELAAPLEEQFSLGEGQLLPIYALRRTGQPLLVAFDQRRERSGPTGSVVSLRTFVAVRGSSSQSAPPMRAGARRGRALERLEAGRSGATRLELPSDPAFDESISVYTREPAGARAVLTAPVRETLRRLLLTADSAAQRVNGVDGSFATTVAPSLVVGQRNLLLCLEPRGVLPVSDLGALLADMLSLHVALGAAGQRLAETLLGDSPLGDALLD